MTTPRTFIAAATFVFCLGANCDAPVDAGVTGGDAGATGDAGVRDAGPQAALAASDYCEVIAPFFCDFYLRCGRMDVVDHATCLERFASGCEGGFEPRYVGLEQAELLSLSQTGVDACESHLSTVSCDEQFLELSGPCSGMWQGAQPEGGGCGIDVESFVCAEGTTCRLDLSFCGECVPAAAVGDACGAASDATCVPDAWCSDDVCIARRGAGESCDDESRCVLGAGCDAGVCTFPVVVAAGATCDADRRCPYETACIGGVCTSTPTLGGACSPSLPCSAGYCAGGVCTASLGPGEACTENASCFAGRCADDGTCAGYPSACIAP